MRAYAITYTCVPGCCWGAKLWHVCCHFYEVRKLQRCNFTKTEIPKHFFYKKLRLLPPLIPDHFQIGMMCFNLSVPSTATDLTDFGRWWLWCRLCWGWGRLCWGLGLMLGLWLRLWLETMSRDLVNLSWCCHVHHVICLHLNFIARWQEGIEAHDQVRVTFEELRHTADHSWSVDTEKEQDKR